MDDEGFSQINVTPLTDVLLVLLIIFLITGSTLTAPRPGVELPRVVTRSEAEAEGLVVDVEASGQAYLEGQPLEDPAAVFAANPGTLLIQADRRTRFEHVDRLLDAARAAGMTGVVLATRLEEP